MKHEAKHLYPIRKTLYEHLPKPFIDDDGAGTKYVAYAQLTVGEDDNGWMIEKHVTAGTVTKVLYPKGSMEFKFKWSDRASYSYTR